MIEGSLNERVVNIAIKTKAVKKAWDWGKIKIIFY